MPPKKQHPTPRGRVGRWERRWEIWYIFREFCGKKQHFWYICQIHDFFVFFPIFFWWTLPLFFCLMRRFPAKSSGLPKVHTHTQSGPTLFLCLIGTKKKSLPSAKTRRAISIKNLMPHLATWPRLPGVYPLKAHLVMLGILSRRWYSEFPSSECQYHPNIWSYLSKFHSERGYVWWVPVLVVALCLYANLGPSTKIMHFSVSESMRSQNG